MESSSYEGMSGTNTINTAAVLLETGLVEMTEPVTRMTLEAPAGLVRVSADCAGGSVERITFENVPSFATHLDARSRSRASATLRVDVAYGGAFCAFVDAAPLGFAIVPDEARELGELGERIRPHINEQLAIAHPASPTSATCRSSSSSPRRAPAATPATRRSSPPAASTAPPRARRPPPAWPCSPPAASWTSAAVRRRERHRHALQRAHRRPREGRRARRDRPRDHRPRLDHGLPPARRRPDRPAGGRLQAARHLGQRPPRGHAEPLVLPGRQLARAQPGQAARLA